MGELEFGYGDKREFYPQYADVDWHSAFMNKHDDDDMPIWAETFDELGDFCEQLNQTNCVLYVNNTNPMFNCIVVVDSRDEGGDWWLSQYQLGEERFTELWDLLAPEVMVVGTKYPAQAVAEYVMQLMFHDIEE
jgi:hypothetical protein